MSNYGYVVLEKSVSNEKLAADLNEINGLLHNQLVIQADWDKVTAEGGECIVVGFPDDKDGDLTLFQLWRESEDGNYSRRTLHTDHRWSPAAYWIEQVIFQFLAKKYGGYMWGESKDDRWYPATDLPLTYGQYKRKHYSRLFPYKKAKELFKLDTMPYYGTPQILIGTIDPRWDDPPPRK